MTQLGLFKRIFDTEPLTLQQWGVAIIAAFVFFVVSEILKLVLRIARN